MTVELLSDVWGTTAVATADPFDEQLPRSTFSPAPVDIAVLDYDTIMAEIARLEARILELKAQATRMA